MSVFTRPLTALSLTAPDEGLLRYASLIAASGGCEEIRFAHVAADGDDRLPASELQALRERMQAEVGAHFSATARRREFDVVQGPRVDQLLSLAEQHGSDVIVLGHRRMRSARRSLARRLALVAPCSVWLVPEASPARVSNILVPVDFSSHSRDALSLATSLAAAMGLPQVLALHVFFDPSTIRYDEHVEEIRGNEEAALADMLAATDCHGVRVEPLYEESTHVSQTIVRVAERHGADLIVMNTRGRSRAAAVFLGSVTSDALAATRIPLLAVKHFGRRMSILQALLNHRFWEERAPKMN
jgi:nucleotide-binding universal stress UspA family protein